jgi:hypothetical protein
MRPIQSAAVPRVWTYRDRSLEKDWRFSVKLSKSGPDKSKRMVGGAVGADGGAAAADGRAAGADGGSAREPVSLARRGIFVLGKITQILVYVARARGSNLFHARATSTKSCFILPKTRFFKIQWQVLATRPVFRNLPLLITFC